MPTDDGCIRVLTVNTHKGFSFLNRRFVLHELREAVRAVGADVVFLQEVQGEHTGHVARLTSWPDTPHYEFMADELWPEYAYGRNAVYPLGHHGNAVLSRFPIVASANHDVTVHGGESRGMLHCQLRIPASGTVIHVICVHLGLQEAHRRNQIELLCGIVKNNVPDDAPLLVAGDFNDWRGRAHNLLAQCAGLHEVFVQAYGRAARTFPARLPLLELDRIYVRGVKVHTPLVLPRRPWSHLSDHAPLAAEIQL